MYNMDTDLVNSDDIGTTSLRSPRADRIIGSDDTRTMDEDVSLTRLAAEELVDKYLEAPGNDSLERDSESQADESNQPQDTQDLPDDEHVENADPASDIKNGQTVSEQDWTRVGADERDDSAGDDEHTSHKSDLVTGKDESELSDTVANCERSAVGSEDGSSNMENGGMNAQETVNRDEGSENTNAEQLTRDEGKENKQPSERVFITENDTGDDEESLSDVRPDTPVWDETGDANEVASLSDIEEFTAMKHARSANNRSARTRSSHSRARPPTRNTIREDLASGQRAVANTPVSYYTAGDFNTETCRNLESRNTSHAGLELAREAVFQQAMTLMTNRCVSVQRARDAPLFGAEAVPFGPHVPEYFYVQQKKPAPMPPLKAWKGYHGNVYFEPIQINKVGDKGGSADGQTDLQIGRRSRMHILSRRSSGQQRTNTPAQQSRALVPVNRGDERDLSMAGGELLPTTRSTTRLTNRRGPASAKSVTSSVAAISQHHVLYLDKHAIINPDNAQMHEELQVIEKQESTGSLAVQARDQESRLSHRTVTSSGVQGDKGQEGTGNRQGAKSAKFDRICRGSVAHKLHRAKSGERIGGGNEIKVQHTRVRGGKTQNGGKALKTELMVIGDRFAPPTVMSPLLRTQTQYSLSSQRMTMNSPDLYGAFERLPPLEQVRMSLRHMDARNEDPFPPPRTGTPYSAGGSLGVIEDLKPFIKYSPDVRAQYNKQIKYY